MGARAADVGAITIVNVVGDAKFESRPLKSGDSFASGGTIEVASDGKSMVDIKYPEGHVFRLKSGARLSIAGEKTANLKTLNLLKGKAFLHFQKDSDANEFKIHTKTAVAGVRGTKFLLEDRDGATYLCVCEGVVELHKPDAKDGRTVTAGQDLWSRPDKPLGQPKVDEGMKAETAAEFESMPK